METKMLGREPLMGETLCDAEREAVLRTGGYKGQACVTDGGQHNNIGTGRHMRGAGSKVHATGQAAIWWLHPRVRTFSLSSHANRSVRASDTADHN